MRYYITHHQHKGKPIEQALRKNGWLFDDRHTDIALFDHAINRGAPETGRRTINTHYAARATIITYPHGATGAWWMDSDLYSTDYRIFANLVIGEGHKYVEEIMQPQLTHHVIGWYYCPILPFKRPNDIKTILFAPMHATMHSNKLREEHFNTNKRVFSELLKLPYNIIVRYLNPLPALGLWDDPKVTYKFAVPDGSYDDIDNADLVIAEGTYMYLSVARGKPTIGMNQHIPIRPNECKYDFTLNNWSKYGDYMAYPIDFDDKPLSELIYYAADKEADGWKKLFIGEKMNGRQLSDLLIKFRTTDLSQDRRLR